MLMKAWVEKIPYSQSCLEIQDLTVLKNPVKPKGLRRKQRLGGSIP